CNCSMLPCRHLQPSSGLEYADVDAATEQPPSLPLEPLPRATCRHHLLPYHHLLPRSRWLFRCAFALTVDGDGWWISAVEVWIYHGSRGGALVARISALTVDGYGGSEQWGSGSGCGVRQAGGASSGAAGGRPAGRVGRRPSRVPLLSYGGPRHGGNGSPHSSPSLDPPLLLHGRGCSSPSAINGASRWRMMSGRRWRQLTTWLRGWQPQLRWSAMEDDVEDEHDYRGSRKKMTMATSRGGRRRW
ncbi:hypothetical protein Dimus_012746, partial [Dionaea muscipula]